MNNDDDLRDLLGPLRDAEPTAAMRRANRMAAEQAVVAPTQRPWWRRTVAVPLPAAAAVAAALVVTTGLAVTPRPGGAPPNAASTAAPTALLADVTTGVRFAPAATGSGRWSAEHTYLDWLEAKAVTATSPPPGERDALLDPRLNPQPKDPTRLLADAG